MTFYNLYVKTSKPVYHENVLLKLISIHKKRVYDVVVSVRIKHTELGLSYAVLLQCTTSSPLYCTRQNIKHTAQNIRLVSDILFIIYIVKVTSFAFFSSFRPQLRYADNALSIK